MFYRYTKAGLRVPMDLDNIFSGSCFIAGGSPVLLEENLSILDQPGISVVAINNTSAIVPATVAVFGDKPLCYSDRILRDPKIMKFGVISRRDYEVAGKPWKHQPNTFFFGTSDDFTVGDLLKPDRDLAWWKNTFFMALQLACRLGFNKAYLIGCQFKIGGTRHYAYDMSLDQNQLDWNTKTYNRAVDNMKFLKPHFDKVGFEVISSTPDSPLNEIYPFVPMRDAVQEILKDYPREYNTAACLHSSSLGENNPTL